ncbi:hypothetical protein AB0C36_38615, partial [Streptodolium elevatio]
MSSSSRSSSPRPSGPGSLTALEAAGPFTGRHIGPDADQQAKMLAHIGFGSLDELTDAAVPGAIRTLDRLDLPEAVSEAAVHDQLRALAARNTVLRPMIGLGYHGTHTPPVILRNVLENPAGYETSSHDASRSACELH